MGTLHEDQYTFFYSYIAFFYPKDPNYFLQLSVYISSWNNSAPNGRIFTKFGIWVFFENLLRKFKCCLNLTRITGTLREDQYTFLIHILLSFTLKILKIFYSCLPIYPHGTTRLPLDGLSRNLISWVFFKNLLRKFKCRLNLTRITGTLHEDQYTFIIHILLCFTLTILTIFYSLQHFNNIGVIAIHHSGTLSVRCYTSTDGGRTIGIVMRVKGISR